MNSLLEALGLSGPGSRWRLLAIIFALLNVKNLPLVWHIRLFKPLLKHFVFSRQQLTAENGPAALFQPAIITSHASLLDCDYNIHKSNSTYFADLDISRANLLASLLKVGLQKLGRRSAKEGKGRFSFALGGVTCSFRREIKPYQSFEIWTRVLAWDRKWLYLVSHVVQKGSVQPKGYTLQPWVKIKPKATQDPKQTDDVGNGNARKGPHPAIFASSIAKYVFKQGRLTISPEKVLQEAALLPPKPADHHTPPDSTSPPVEGTSIDIIAATALSDLNPMAMENLINGSLEPGSAETKWDWNQVEAERQKGMRLAELMAGLEALHDEFTGEERAALGHDWDI